MEEVSKLTGLYSNEEALWWTREGLSTLPRPADPTRFAPQPAEQSQSPWRTLTRATGPRPRGQ